jgi:N-formylglutamate deformylase
MTPVEVTIGDGPVVLGMPHTGTWLPDDVRAALNDRGRTLSDTDWHIDRLYDGLLPGATVVRATFHRYAIDANRPPDGASLYPGQNTTGLVPLTDFDGNPIWDTPPDAAQIEARRAAFHAPYHAALSAQMERVRNRHGVAILYDCHSIRSRVPYLFDGVLPDFNIGTASGVSCDRQMADRIDEICAQAEGYRHILNGRFKGGWTTRHYGQPLQGWHAVQMELAQSTHLATETAPWSYDTDRADRLRPHLAAILAALVAIAPELRSAKI